MFLKATVAGGIVLSVNPGSLADAKTILAGTKKLRKPKAAFGGSLSGRVRCVAQPVPGNVF